MHKAIIAVMICFATAIPAAAQKAVMRDGHPALDCRGTIGSLTWSIQQVDFNGRPALKIPAVNFGAVAHGGILFISEDRIVFQSGARTSLDERRSSITREGWAIRAGGKRYWFSPPGGYAPDNFPDCVKLIDLAITDFAAAEQVFGRLARSLPSVQIVAWREFQPKAAAWRALPSKPAVSDAVRQQRLLAENAFKQQQFSEAAAAYEAGLEINPLWPEGHFNAAMIYAELKQYDDAAWHMRCYLELMPNAQDAVEARDQMLLWQGLAQQQAAATVK
jgi:hypothetical protein